MEAMTIAGLRGPCVGLASKYCALSKSSRRAAALIAFHVIHAIVSSYRQPGELPYGRHETGLR